MANLGTKLPLTDLIPAFGKKYVDHIIKKNDLEEKSDLLNRLPPNIEFTMKMKRDLQLPFLDLQMRKKQKKLDLEILRKPTDTRLVSTCISNRAQQHKATSFNHMIHRILTLPFPRRA